MTAEMMKDFISNKDRIWSRGFSLPACQLSSSIRTSCYLYVPFVLT